LVRAAKPAAPAVAVALPAGQAAIQVIAGGCARAPPIRPSQSGRLPKDRPPEHQGTDFYSRLVDELRAAGIEPFATLYRWDLPQTLHDRYGGWQSKDTAKAFADHFDPEVMYRVPRQMQSLWGSTGQCGGVATGKWNDNEHDQG
jgi:Glycosyl hydrolase family 1